MELAGGPPGRPSEVPSSASLSFEASTGVFKGYRALAVTSQALLNYVAKRQREKAANATINREIEAIRRAFVLAVEAGTLSFVPKVPRLRQDNAPRVLREG